MGDNESAANGLMENEIRYDHQEEESNNDNRLKDKYHLSLLLLYILGTLTQIPSNFFITANDYWMYKFRDTNESHPPNSKNKTELQTDFTSNFSIISNVATMLSIFATMFFLRNISMKVVFSTTLCIITGVFVVTLAFVEVDTDEWQSGFYGLTLATGFILTAATGAFMISVYRTAGKFPPRYIASVISGQSICGIFAALTQIFILGIGASPTITASIYFFIGTVFIVGSSISFYLVYKNSDHFRWHFTEDKDDNTIKNTQQKFSLDNIRTVLYKIRWYLICMVLVLGCSIMVHPAVTSLVVSTNKGNGNKWNDVFFIPVCTFLFYNVFDLIGRELAAMIKKPTNGIVLMMAAIARFAFIPLLMFCNAEPRKHTEVLLRNDYAYIVLIIIFAFSNGYIMNLAILQIPKTVVLSEKKISIILILIVIIVSLGVFSTMNVLLVKAL